MSHTSRRYSCAHGDFYQDRDGLYTTIKLFHMRFEILLNPTLIKADHT